MVARRVPGSPFRGIVHGMLGAEQAVRQTERERERSPLDPHPWRAAMWLGLAVVAAGMAWSMVAWPLIDHARSGTWLPPPDVWHPMVAAREIVRGSFGYIYRPDQFYVAGPLFALFLAPVEALSRALQLSE